jgi:hypothetical protein
MGDKLLERSLIAGMCLISLGFFGCSAQSADYQGGGSDDELRRTGTKELTCEAATGGAKLALVAIAGGKFALVSFKKDGALYATQRGEVTRLKDTNGDGKADLVETVNDDWGINGDYHDYAFGTKFDKEGNIWVVLCLTGSFTSEVPYRGWCLRISPDGKSIPTCSGVRSPGR